MGHSLIFGLPLILGAYLLGSLPTGVLLSRRRGVDIQTLGSGNPGATNVARVLGKKLGAVVLVLDALKGALPVLAAQRMDFEPTVAPLIIAGCGVFAVLGHCFSALLRFRGGKGVATALGVIVAVNPLVAGVAAAGFAALYAMTRLVSVGSLAAASATPALLWWQGSAQPIIGMAAIIALLIALRHRANLRRLLRHEELKL